jgi:Mce-associated membrane protein
MSIETDEERTDHPPATDEESTPTGATEADAADMSSDVAPDVTPAATPEGAARTARPASEEPSEEDTDTESADGGTDTGRRRLWWVVASGVVVIALVVAATWIAILEQTASARDADRAAAVATARQTVITMTTTDPTRAQESFQQLTELATGSFGQQLQAQSDTFVRVVQGAGVTSRSEITESGFVAGDDRRATVLVVANSVVQNSQAPQGEPRQYRMKLELDKQGDRWLVSNLDFVA